MEMDPDETAVVLIEYQNDFTSEGGALHDAVKGVMDDNKMIENTRKVVAEARAAGVTVLHAPITFAPGYGELGDPDKVYGISRAWSTRARSSRAPGVRRSVTSSPRRRTTS